MGNGVVTDVKRVGSEVGVREILLILLTCWVRFASLGLIGQLFNRAASDLLVGWYTGKLQLFFRRMGYAR